MTFTQIQDENLPVDNLDLSSDVNGGERVVSRDHDTLSERRETRRFEVRNSRSLGAFDERRPKRMMGTYSVGRIGQHLESLDGIGLEWAVEDEESSESKSNLDLISSELVDLRAKASRGGRSDSYDLSQPSPTPFHPIASVLSASIGMIDSPHE